MAITAVSLAAFKPLVLRWRVLGIRIKSTLRIRIRESVYHEAVNLTRTTESFAGSPDFVSTEFNVSAWWLCSAVEAKIRLPDQAEA